MVPLYAIKCPECKMLVGEVAHGNHLGPIPVPRHNICHLVRSGGWVTIRISEYTCDGSGMLGEAINYTIPGMLS